MRRLILPGLLVVVAALLAACGSLEIGITPSADVPAATSMPTEAVPAATQDTGATPDPIMTEDPAATDEPAPAETGEITAADCPAAGEGQAQVIDEEAGYCFLYPASFRLVTEFSQTEHQTALVGEPLNPESMEPIAASMQVTMTGPAVYVNNSAEYASMWREMTGFGELVGPGGGPIGPAEAIDVNGYPAALLRGMPGMPGGITAFVVANGVKYNVSMQPETGMWEGLDAQLNELWSTVTGSILFFTPTAPLDVVLAEDVCPEATADMALLVNRIDGFCYLYPAQYEPSEDFSGGITAGPTVDVPNFGPMRARLVVAWAGTSDGQTPDEIIAQWEDSGLDLSTVEEVTVGGYPAVSYMDTRGPVDQPGMHIVANGNVYTVVANPYEPEDFPEVAAIVDNMWTSVTGSMQFFDRWR